MDRWVTGRLGDPIYLVNTIPAVCEACGAELAEGEGHVWRCYPGSGTCSRPEQHQRPGLPRGGWHCTCRAVEACQRRRAPRGALSAPVAPEELSAAVQVEEAPARRLEPAATVFEATEQRAERLRLITRTEAALSGRGLALVIEVRREWRHE